MSSELKRFLGHCVAVILISVLIIGGEIGLSFAKDFCIKTQRPEYYVWWIHYMAITGIIIEGVLVPSVLGIAGWQFLEDLWKRKK